MPILTTRKTQGRIYTKAARKMHKTKKKGLKHVKKVMKKRRKQVRKVLKRTRKPFIKKRR